MMTNDEKSKLSRKGLDVRLPEMDVFPNLFPGYRVTLSVPEYTSLCPKTGHSCVKVASQSPSSPTRTLKMF